ncbi:MAG: hypothetical protein IPG71_03105 [bacterium]|nr:hypothetical protein [bacterium]
MISLTILFAIGIGLGFVVLTLVADRTYLFFKNRKKPDREFSNAIPGDITSLISEEKLLELLGLYQKEWSEVIEVQMHFNDLIIKFRASTLTVLAALFGGSIALLRLSPGDVSIELIYGVPLLFWATAFLIDFFYYHRLLLGAVEQAKKFDKNPLLKRYGLCGLSQCVSKHVHPTLSNILLFLYYFVPIVGGLVLLGLSH